jgi:hypothetical protein
MWHKVKVSQSVPNHVLRSTSESVEFGFAITTKVVPEVMQSDPLHALQSARACLIHKFREKQKKPHANLSANRQPPFSHQKIAGLSEMMRACQSVAAAAVRLHACIPGPFQQTPIFFLHANFARF